MTCSRFIATPLAFVLGFIPVAMAGRGERGAADHQWYLLEEGKQSMEVVASLGPSGGGRGPLLMIGTHFLVTSPFGAPAIPGTSVTRHDVRMDYAYRLAEFDCATPGRQRTLARFAYRLDSATPASTDTHFTPWENAVPIAQESARRLWRIACEGEAPGKAMPRLNEYADFTRAYRQRQADAAHQAEAEARQQAVRDRRRARAQAATQVVAGTGLDIATVSPHWHYTQVSQLALAGIDVHGAADGPAAKTRRMSSVLLQPQTEPMFGDEPSDFTVMLEEFDCAQLGRNRTIALASYAVEAGTPALVAAAQNPDVAWNIASEGQHPRIAWEWACRGDQKTNTLPAGQTFMQLVAWYRAQLAAVR